MTAGGSGPSNVPARPVLIAAGNQVVSATPATLWGLLLGVVAAGQTIKLHDCTTVGAAAAGNERFRFATDAVNEWNTGNVGAYFEKGIVAIVSGGTPVATAIVG